MATTKIKVPVVFDQAKLQAMAEPLTVRVEKKRAGGMNEPIPVPGKDGGRNGTGWSRDEVLDLENWVLTELAGGGYYRFQVTDANGEVMFWEAAYDPRVYPERIPYASQSAAVATNPVPAAAPAPAPAPAPAAIPPSIAPAVPVSAPGPQPMLVPTTPLGSNPSQWPPPGAALYGGPVAHPTPQPQPQPQPVQPVQPAVTWPPPYQPSQQFLGYGPGGQPMWGAAPSYAPYNPPFATSLRGFGRSSRPDYRRYDDEEKTTHDTERRQYEDRIRVLDDQLRQTLSAQRELEYKTSLERQQQQHANEMIALREEIRRLGEQKQHDESAEVKLAREEKNRLERDRERDQISMQFREMQELIKKVVERPADDPRLRQLEQDLAKQREDHRIMLEQQQRERERWEAQRAQEALSNQIKEQERKTETLIRDATANKTDPMVEYMKESARLSQEQSRLQSENMREIARMQQASSDRMASMMMTPQALAGLIKDSSQGADILLKNMIGSFSGIFDTFRGAVDQIVQLSGGPPEPPSVRLIEQGISRASQMAERYFGAKAAQAQSDAHVKATQIQADAQLRAAALQAQAAQAQAQAQAARRPEVERKRNGQQQQAGLNGPAMAPPAQAGRPVQPKPPVEVAQGAADPTTGHTVAMPRAVPTKRAGHTDEEWFGPAMESVGRLRLGAKTFVDNLHRIHNGEEPTKAPDGSVDGLDPDAAVDAVLKGINYVTAASISVLAFDELFKQGMFAEFTDVLLPDVPQVYRDDCVKILTDEVQVAAVGRPEVIDVASASDDDLEDQPTV